MAEVSFPHFPEEEHECAVIDEIVTLDSFPFWSHMWGPDSDQIPSRRHRHRVHHPSSSIAAIDDIFGVDHSDRVPGFVGLDSADRENQVSFVMDLFHQRVEQSHLMGSEEFMSEPVDYSSFRLIGGNREMGVNCLDIDLRLGLGLERGVELDEDEDDEDGNCAGLGFVVSDCGDEFFIARRESANGNPGSSSSLGGLRVVRIESDSEEDDGNELLGIDVHSEEEDYGLDNVNYDDVNIPLCWDSLQLEDHGEANNEFEWEEVDGRVDEREVLSFVADPVEEESISVLPISGPGEEEDGDRGRGLGSLEWEVLLNVNNLDRSPDMENDVGPSFGDNDDYVYTVEYEMMFGQFTDAENTFLGRPPASKSVVEKLPSVVMTEEDVLNERALCAVCKDQIEAGKKARELPCSHRYHADCILPWLSIRNTCPVCRYELPTDDPDYEQRRVRRAARAP